MSRRDKPETSASSAPAASEKSAIAERRGSLRTLAAILPKITAQSLGKQGFATAAVITDWPLIIGKELAAATLPQRITFPTGKRREGILHIRVASAMALDVQHRAPQILARINGYFGYAAVAQIKLTQGAIARPALTSRPIDPMAPVKRVEAPSGDDSKNVAAALERLGAAIAADSSRRRQT
ncbi:MAG: DciA family protein [Alphaproteobacteria bacterium]